MQICMISKLKEHQNKTNEQDFIKLTIYTKTGIAKNTKNKTME